MSTRTANKRIRVTIEETGERFDIIEKSVFDELHPDGMIGAISVRYFDDMGDPIEIIGPFGPGKRVQFLVRRCGYSMIATSE